MPSPNLRRLRLRVAIGALVVAGLVAVCIAGPGRLERGAKSVLAFWPNHQRARARVAEAPFSHLAASQVGYGPAMQKRFTSPRRFEAFQVIREEDGTAVLEGAPLCELPTPGLGVDAVFIGDFSALTAPGRYHLVAGGLTSHPFAVGGDVFDQPLRAVQRAFYFQRAFTGIDAAHAEGPWIHASDAALAPSGVRGGWHDAGDFSLYSASLNTALFWLLETYRDFAPQADDTNIPESGNGVPDLLDEARWGLEWLLSLQDAGGGFRNTTCQDRYGPYGTNTPEGVPPYRAGEVGTLATARAVGTLADASTIWRRFDPGFADRTLEAARRGASYLAEHPETSDGPTCPAYRADGDLAQGRHTRMYAAAGMLLATGEARYRDDFERSYVELDADPSFLRFNGFAARLYLLAPQGTPERRAAIEERLRLHAARVLAEGTANPFQRAAPTHWGSISGGFTRTGFSSVRRCLTDPAAAAADCAQALANIHHALGRNSLQLSYLSGLSGVTHGRRRAFHHWLAALRAEPFLFPGLVAGGPNASPEPADVSNPLARPIPIWGYWGDPAFPRDERTPYEERYTDNDSWSTNEVSLEWQATALYALAFAQWVAKNPPVFASPSAPAAVEVRRVDGKLPRCDQLRGSD